MLNKKKLFIGGLLLALPLASCSIELGGDEEATWDISADKQEAVDAFKEVVSDLAKISRVKVTMDFYSGGKDVEEIDGTNEYTTQESEEEGKLQVWLFIENGTYYTAHLYEDEETGRYYVGKSDYEDSFKHYVKILSRFEQHVDLNTYTASFTNKGESKTVDGVYTGKGTIEASFKKDDYNFYSYKANTDGQKVLEIDYKMSEGASGNAKTYYSCLVTFDYDAEFTFTKPDLTEWRNANA